MANNKNYNELYMPKLHDFCMKNGVSVECREYTADPLFLYFDFSFRTDIVHCSRYRIRKPEKASDVQFAEDFLLNRIATTFELKTGKNPFESSLMEHQKIMLRSIFKSKNNYIPEIKKVIFNEPATIVFWEDGTKTIVKYGKEHAVFDPEKGLAMAIAKKALGNTGHYYETFKKWLPEEE